MSDTEARDDTFNEDVLFWVFVLFGGLALLFCVTTVAYMLGAANPIP